MKIAEFMSPGTFAVLESTTYPGTTEELILPKLEESGLKVGEDFFLAFSPERVDPGNPIYQTHNTPKVVGGVTEACNEVAEAFYETTIEHVVMVSSTKAAEMVKLLENTFRSVNIGLVNEVALMCDRLGISAWEIIDAAATKPFGFMPFYPGPGLGGHCIPIDPHYLSWKLKSLNYYARFIELAGEINGSMPAYVVSQAGEILNKYSKSIKGSKIVLLGMAYKRDISDVRESPALDLLKLFQEKGADVVYNDPYVKSIQWIDGLVESVPVTKEILAGADLVVIATDHKVYDWEMIVENSRLILDTRNSLKKYDLEKIYKLGGGRFPATVGMVIH
jgi:UDP-N-acetyl-D-glucosamine dehydrogenase